VEDLNLFKSDFVARSLRSFLDIAILARLEDTPVNGYGITIFFMKKFGVSISTSTVYSTLYALERTGIVKRKPSWKGRVYELTEKGKSTLKDNRNRLGEAQNFLRILRGKENCINCTSDSSSYRNFK
jgi:DNA-binding PadR family transcriptional regulator